MIIEINENNEPKPKPGFRMTGRPTSVIQEMLSEENNWMFERFANHGNIAAHAFGNIHDQINKERDILHADVFHKDGRSLNRFITRGMFFCGTTMRTYDLKYRKTVQNDILNSSLPFGYYLTPIIYIYDIKKILNLVDVGKATYFEEKIPTYTHQTGDSTHEIRLHDRHNLPQPEFIILGRGCASLKKEHRLDIEMFHESVGVDILHLPHIRLVIGKSDESSGNMTCSPNAIRIIQCIRSIYD